MHKLHIYYANDGIPNRLENVIFAERRNTQEQ